MLHRLRSSLSGGLLVALTAFSLTALSAHAANPRVEFDTTEGKITVEVDPAAAPKTVENFLSYVKAGHYDGTLFHRVISGFMIQGGGYATDMKEKPTKAPVQNEAEQSSKAGFLNTPGTIAMARTSDPHSATSQFFINVVDNGMLNYTDDMKPGYAVFGKVTAGQDTVDKIRKVPTATVGGHGNVPTTPVIIEKAECA